MRQFGLVLIVVGYGYIMVEFGWPGIAAAVAHVGTLMLTIKR